MMPFCPELRVNEKYCDACQEWLTARAQDIADEIDASIVARLTGKCKVCNERDQLDHCMFPLCEHCYDVLQTVAVRLQREINDDLIEKYRNIHIDMKAFNENNEIVRSTGNGEDNNTSPTDGTRDQERDQTN